MSDTALSHPFVREYLRELDAALAGLPAPAAGELREQITTHLEDVLDPRASNRETAEVLLRLGSPRDLAAEAGAGAGPDAGAGAGAPGWPVPRRRSPLRRVLARFGWRSRALAAVTLIAVAAVTWYTVTAYTVGALGTSGAYGWWYAQDQAHQVETSADEARQDTVPIRPGERQGLYVAVYNPGPWTQTVLGYAGNDAQSPGAHFAQLRVAARLSRLGGGGSPVGVGYRLPGAIPPYSWRFVRVLWTSVGCLPPGSAMGIDQLALDVRVGVFHRTEIVPLPEGFFLSGSAAASDCS